MDSADGRSAFGVDHGISKSWSKNAPKYERAFQAGLGKVTRQQTMLERGVTNDVLGRPHVGNPGEKINEALKQGKPELAEKYKRVARKHKKYVQANLAGHAAGNKRRKDRFIP